MFKKAQTYKQNQIKEKNKFEINRVVIESFYSSNRKNEGKIIKVNNNVYNLRNIDNNMSRGNLNENIDNDSHDLQITKNKTKPIYTLCNQTNFIIISRIKKFDAPLLINNNSFNILIQKKEKEDNIINKKNQPNINEKQKVYLIKSFDIFISGNQNLKSKNIHITNSSKKDNVVHKEILDLKNAKNKIEEKIEVNNKNIEKNNLINALEVINKRWKKEQNEFKMRISFFNKSEVLMINLEKYKQELISKINFDKTNSNDKDNYYIFIKQDNKSKDNKFIYEIIKPNSKKDCFNDIFNKFITNDNKENELNILNNSNDNNNGKKKSKLINLNPSNTNNKNNNINFANKNFCPLLIFSYKELKTMIKNIEKDLKISPNEREEKYIIEENISFNYIRINDEEHKKQLKEKQKEKANINMILIPTKVDEYKLLHNYENFKAEKLNEIILNKIEKNNIKEIHIKKSEDFGQSTPIHLLKNKYFIYAVSKWSKYSTINPEINIFYNYCYKSGHPKFDSNILEKNNFYIMIEKIKIDNFQKKSRNLNNFNGLKKTISTSKMTVKTNNEKNITQITKSSYNSKDIYNNINSTIGKKSMSKQKLDKNKNK